MEKKDVIYQIKSLEKLYIRTLIPVNFEKLELGIGPSVSIPTPTQMLIIEYGIMHSNEGVFQKDLENVLNLRRATVSGVLQTMEKNGLVERVTDSEDERTKKIILKQKAIDVYKENIGRIKKLEAIVTKNISQDELEIFFNVINKMKCNLKDDLGEQKKGDKYD